MPQASIPTIEAILATLQEGRADAAEQLSRRYLAVEPDDEDGLTLLGFCLQEQGRTADAASTYQQLTRLAPHSAFHWNNLASAQRAQGQLREAEASYRRALEIDPEFFGALINLGYLLLEAGNYPQARQCFLDAHRLDVASPEARIYAAQTCVAMDERDLAERLIKPWRTWIDLPDDLLLDLAALMTACNLSTEGRQLLANLLQRDPHNHRAAAQMVILFERLNQLDEARALLARLPAPESIDDAKLQFDVLSAQAALALREQDTARARALLERLIAAFDASPAARNTPWRGDHLHFSLAKILDREGAVDAAMGALAAAHECQLGLARQAVPELLLPGTQPLYTATRWLSAETIAAWPDYPAPCMLESPIFVVGFPRSGTTMLEQMLDAHPQLQAMDERAYLQNLIEHMSSFGLRYPDDLHKLSASQCEALRRLYWRLSARDALRENGQRLVDKNPLHMLRLPLIQRLFPNAPIILALRHPCDVILSNYMQHFRSNSFAVLCSSLERLAAGYRIAMSSWVHHANLLQPNLIHSRYEDLLEDFAGNIARIGAFLALDDATPLARFDTHAREKGFISTPSYTRVIEPPNKQAVGRWRRYEAYFEKAVPILRPFLQHWNYSV